MALFFVGMVEKWKPVLRPQDLRPLGPPKLPGIPAPSGPLEPQDLRIPGKSPVPFQPQNLNI